jgi:hypothetical protein
VSRKSHVYRAQVESGGFEAPVPLSISDGAHPGYDVAVAPDESFLVFSANRVPAAKDQSLLFVAFRRTASGSSRKRSSPTLRDSSPCSDLTSRPSISKLMKLPGQ